MVSMGHTSVRPSGYVIEERAKPVSREKPRLASTTLSIETIGFIHVRATVASWRTLHESFVGGLMEAHIGKHYSQKCREKNGPWFSS